jgi:hypothetical protein
MISSPSPYSSRFATRSVVRPTAVVRGRAIGDEASRARTSNGNLKDRIQSNAQRQPATVGLLLFLINLSSTELVPAQIRHPEASVIKSKQMVMMRRRYPRSKLGPPGQKELPAYLRRSQCPVCEELFSVIVNPPLLTRVTEQEPLPQCR